MHGSDGKSHGLIRRLGLSLGLSVALFSLINFVGSSGADVGLRPWSIGVWVLSLLAGVCLFLALRKAPAPAVGERADNKITGQINLERDLAQLQSFVFQEMSEGVSIIDADGRILQMNPAAQRMVGFLDASKETLLEDYKGKVLHEDGSPFEPEDFPAVRTLRTGVAARDQIMGVQRPTGLIWISINTAPLIDDGRMIGVVATFSDVSALIKAEQRLVDAIENIPDGVSIWDAEDRMILTNEHHREHFPLIADDMQVGAKFEELVRIGIERGQYRLSKEGADAFVKERMAHHKSGDATFEQMMPDGRWLQRRERATGEGGVVTVSTDITETKRALHALEQRELALGDSLAEQAATAQSLKVLAADLEAERDRANAANLAKSQFLATMSHELRTPLNAIMGFSDAIRLETFGALGKPQYKDYASHIFESGERLLDLINDVLDMSKIEAGRYELLYEFCDLNAMVDRALRMVRGRADDGGVTLEWQPVQDVELEGDQRAIEQVLINLLSNAVKFTPAGGKVKVEAHGGDGWLTLVVDDTGIGIPKEDQATIFEPFVQAERAKRRKHHEGTGLGLSLSRNLVLLHGGEIYLESDEGKGACFVVRLPLAKPIPDDPLGTSSGGHGSRVQNNLADIKGSGTGL